MIQFLSATGSASMTETLFTLLPMILIIVFMFILIYLPQKRQDKKDAAMRSSIEIGDKVSTIGGIVGPAVTAPRVVSAAPPLPAWRSWTWAARTPPLLRSNFAQRHTKTPPCIVFTVQGGVLLWLKVFLPICPDDAAVRADKMRQPGCWCRFLRRGSGYAFCCWRWLHFS